MSRLAEAQRDYRLHKLAPRYSHPHDDPEPEAQDLYGFCAREIDTPAVRAEAARQWDAIPTEPEELRRWMRGDPINQIEVTK
jgi:hypothetical protein